MSTGEGESGARGLIYSGHRALSKEGERAGPRRPTVERSSTRPFFPVYSLLFQRLPFLTTAPTSFGPPSVLSRLIFTRFPRLPERPLLPPAWRQPTAQRQAQALRHCVCVRVDRHACPPRPPGPCPTSHSPLFHFHSCPDARVHHHPCHAFCRVPVPQLPVHMVHRPASPLPGVLGPSF